MERARNATKRARLNPSGTNKRKTSKFDGSEKCGSRQQSLVDMFATQKKKSEVNVALPRAGPIDGFNELIEIIDLEQFDDVTSKTDEIVKDVKEMASYQENSLNDENLDAPLREFLEDDDSLFSTIDTENLVQMNSQRSQHTAVNSYPPYYVENFKKVIQSVCHDPFFSYLLDDDDKVAVDLYLNKLTLSQQKLYARVYLRKYRWLRSEQLLYIDIEGNITNLADSLVAEGMFIDATALTDLNEALKCLNASEVKTLAKSLQFNPSLSRTELISTIESHSKKNSIASFFSNSSLALSQVVLNKVKNQLGPCYKLEASKRSIFIRIMMLSALCNTVSDDDFSGQQQIFQMLSSAIGLTKFPDYDINRKSKVFRDRPSLIRYGEVLESESKLWQKVENKKYDEALEIYKKAKEDFADCLNDRHELDHVMSLPLHLKVFTSGAAYVRILSRGVSVLQFLKKFDEAVVQLKELISQKYFHLDYRGCWYNRLTLNLDFHLKQPQEAIKYITDALNDPSVRTGHRLDILNRGKKILTSKSKKVDKTEMGMRFDEDIMNSIKEAPHVTIIGHQLHKPVPTGGSVWLYGKEDVTVMSGVEQFALEHYSKNGFPEGIHGEGLTFTCMFNLLCWDIVFDDSIPDTFYNHFQKSPLDLRTDNFYLQREPLFQKRLKILKKATPSELGERVEHCWKENYGTSCSGLDWELFRDVEHAKGLVKSCGGSLLSGIFDRLARQMRFVTGGVPDLIVWNPMMEKIKFVEVKGPGDKLSSKQILWLDYLLSLGADAEVCHIKAESSKKLKS